MFFTELNDIGISQSYDWSKVIAHVESCVIKGNRPCAIMCN